MLYFNDATLEQIAIHSVGNKTQEEELFLSNSKLVLDEGIQEVLAGFFTRPFKENQFYEFSNESGLQFNEVYTYCKEIFKDPETLFDQSVKLAKHLYETSEHPNIKGGEYYIVYFSDCKINEDYVDAIGLFKSENKDTYLKVYQKYSDIVAEHEKGINITKMDKGCLIFDTEEEAGYKVCVVDSTSKSLEDVAKFWVNDYLQVKPKEDHYYHTQNYMGACKGFVKDVFNDQNDIPKTDQLKLVEKSLDFFNTHEVFNKGEFRQEVLEGDDGLSEAFDDYKTNFSERNDVEMFDEFDISKTAVKSQKKFFKNIIKLDKRFTLYVHGGHDYMEKDFDEMKKMNYYKLYFNEEVQKE